MKHVVFEYKNLEYIIQDYSVWGKYADDIQIDDVYVETLDGDEVDDMYVLDAAVEYLYDRCADSLYEKWLDQQISMAEYLGLDD